MHHISELLYRRFTGEITPREQAELDEWVSQSESHRQLYKRLTQPSDLENEYRLRGLIDADRAEAEMMRRIRSAEAPTRRRRNALRAAAAIAVLVACGFLFTLLTPSGTLEPEVTTVRNITSFDDLTPGTPKAVLIDQNGDSIVLDNDSSEPFSSPVASAHTDGVTEPRILNLEVPRGGEFQVILEDSTHVWLNSETVISYPEEFGDCERRVRLKGEAYFEVREDSRRPFYVETGHQVVRVYGTKFNIRGYTDENAVFTTLESGSIGLRALDGTGGEVLLSPGYQSVLTSGDSRVALRRVDSETISGWRHGRFVFEEQPLATIIRDLSRWYNFEYEFSNPEVAEIIFMGSIPRYSSFATAAQILENSGNIHFDINDGKVVISRK